MNIDVICLGNVDDFQSSSEFKIVYNIILSVLWKILSILF